MSVVSSHTDKNTQILVPRLGSKDRKITVVSVGTGNTHLVAIFNACEI